MPPRSPGGSRGRRRATALTQGYLEGELVRRITGQTFGQFAAEQVTGPLGVDFHIGTSAEHDARIAHVIPGTGRLVAGAGDEALARRAIENLPDFEAGAANTTAWRRAEIRCRRPWNARSGRPRARPHGVRRRGQWRAAAVTEGIEPVFDEQCYGQDLLLPLVVRHGIGFGLPCPEMPISPSERSCFWGGWVARWR